MEISDVWTEKQFFYPHNRVRYVKDGNEFIVACRTLFESAKHEIFCEFYILNDDETGRYFCQHLVAAAQRGVWVRLHLDAFGCAYLSDALVSELKTHGVDVQFFHPLSPWKKNWGIGRRLHRKVVVVDAKDAIVSGFNVGNEYVQRLEKRGWLDMGLHVTGPAAYEIRRLCNETWMRGEGYKGQKPRVDPPTTAMAPEGTAYVMPQINFWYRGLYQIYTAYLNALRRANRSAVIACAYFMPNLSIRNALRRAVRRGVRVQLILSRQSDVPVMAAAARHLYAWLLKTGVEVYEWKPSHVHAKVAVIDKVWCTVGSFNLDELSVYANLEMNLSVLDSGEQGIAHEVHTHLEWVIANECHRITQVEWGRRRWIVSFYEWLCYHGMRLMFRIARRQADRL